MNTIDEIKQRIDSIDLISRYSPLKKAGTSYKANCPFHTERTPSFVVFPNTGTWRCFGACGVGGDIFDFVMRKENLDFREALQVLADEAGVELIQQNKNSQDNRARLYEMNQVAADYFQYILRHHPAAEQVRNYLQERGIDEPTQKIFQLGFALDGWHGLRDILDAKGYSHEEQITAGLIKKSEEGRNTYDAFRARVIIPIRDKQGRAIGFGGRILGNGQPKYLNTAETLLFHKSDVVYSIDLAHKAIKDADKVVIVEGYMDVIAAHQHGFKNVVACMGTALTDTQLKQLQRYTNNFVLALDADSAGQQATIRGLNNARQALSKVHKPIFASKGRLALEERLVANLHIASIPVGQDPDDLIRQGAGLWRQVIKEAQPLVDFYFDIVGNQYDLSSAYGKSQAVTELSPLINELGDDVERQHYIQKLSSLVNVDVWTINGRVKAASKSNKMILETKQAVKIGQLGAALGESLTVEEHLLANFLNQPDVLMWMAGVSDKLGISSVCEDDLNDAKNREIFRHLKQFMMGDESWCLESFQSTLPDPVHGRLAKLINHSLQNSQLGQRDMEKDTVKALLRLRIQTLNTTSQSIRHVLQEAQRDGDGDTLQNFVEINNQALQKRSHLDKLIVNLGQLLIAL